MELELFIKQLSEFTTDNLNAMFVYFDVSNIDELATTIAELYKNDYAYMSPPLQQPTMTSKCLACVNSGKNKGFDVNTETCKDISMNIPDKLPFELRDVDFNKDIVFQFYSKSKDMSPGKGAGEKIPDVDISRFSKLAEIKNWRKILSNFYEGAFELDGLKWLSVEHLYHASKFKKSNPDFYKEFSLDSNSEISKSPVMAKSAGGKTGKYRGVQIRPKHIVMDVDFFSSKEHENAMFRAQLAKYTQNNEAKHTLLETQDAKLQHFVRGQPPIVFYDTMKIRELLM